ncbi:MAG: hypothetical protein QM760_19295 [Nibricoccus sp.]
MLAAAATAVASPNPHTPRPAHPGDLSGYRPQLLMFRKRMSDIMRDLICGPGGVDAIARKADDQGHRYVYTVEVAQAMEHFAAARLLEPYLKLREFAVKHLIVFYDPKESYTKGFVIWRCVPVRRPTRRGRPRCCGSPGALWRGADAFGRTEDRAVAVTIVEGVRPAPDGAGGRLDDQQLLRVRVQELRDELVRHRLRHRLPPGGVRLAPGEAGRGRPGQAVQGDWPTTAGEWMRQTPSPCGLLYDLVQPELKTMYWGLDVCFFSPNDVIQTNNACTTAMTVARDVPEVAKGVLSFLLRRVQQSGGIHRYFYGRNGEPVNKMKLGPAEMMSAAMLAAKLNDPAAVGAFIDLGMVYWQSIAARTVDTLPEVDAWAWLVSELLIGIDVLLAAA